MAPKRLAAIHSERGPRGPATSIQQQAPLAKKTPQTIPPRPPQLSLGQFPPAEGSALCQPAAVGSGSAAGGCGFPRGCFPSRDCRAGVMSYPALRGELS